MASTTAKVQLTIELYAGSWGDDCTISQVKSQAAESALGDLRRVFQREQYRIIGDPVVISVMHGDAK